MVSPSLPNSQYGTNEDKRRIQPTPLRGYNAYSVRRFCTQITHSLYACTHVRMYADYPHPILSANIRHLLALHIV